jgi:hypothetical protein
MDHVRERCVLLRACWRVELSRQLGAELAGYGTPPGTAHPVAHSAAGGCADARCRAGAAAEREGSGGEATGGAMDEEAGAGADMTHTYARTVTIVCDGQVRLVRCGCDLLAVEPRLLCAVFACVAGFWPQARGLGQGQEDKLGRSGCGHHVCTRVLVWVCLGGELGAGVEASRGRAHAHAWVEG